MITVGELSTEFDVLFNNIMSNQAPGLNNYEKSVFLTKAQSQLIHEYFNPLLDQTDGGFDRTTRRQYDFSKLIVNDSKLVFDTSIKYDLRGLVCDAPTDALYMLNEQLIWTVTISTTNTETQEVSVSTEDVSYKVQPISYNEYTTLISKPYKYPQKGIIWRLIHDGKYEFIGRIGFSSETNPSLAATYKLKDLSEYADADLEYRYRYVKEPAPILLDNFSSYNVSIQNNNGNGSTPVRGLETTATNTTLYDGSSNITGSTAVGEMPDEFYKDVLERAVTLAKLAWQGNTMTQAVMASQSKDK